MSLKTMNMVGLGEVSVTLSYRSAALAEPLVGGVTMPAFPGVKSPTRTLARYKGLCNVVASGLA